MYMNTKPSIGTISRIIVLFIVLINQIVLAIWNKPIIPGLDESEAYNIVSTVLTFIVSTYAAWKNNSFTKNAIAADAYKQRLDMGHVDEDGNPSVQSNPDWQ